MVQQVPVQQTPMQQMPMQQMPGQQMPMQQMPTQQMPGQQAPVPTQSEAMQKLQKSCSCDEVCSCVGWWVGGGVPQQPCCSRKTLNQTIV